MSCHGVHLGRTAAAARTAHLSPASVWHVSVFTWHDVKEYLYFAMTSRETHFSLLTYCITGLFTCVCIARDICIIVSTDVLSGKKFCPDRKQSLSGCMYLTHSLRQLTGLHFHTNILDVCLLLAPSDILALVHWHVTLSANPVGSDLFTQ